jgi:hypothetical protein
VEDVALVLKALIVLSMMSWASDTRLWTVDVDLERPEARPRHAHDLTLPKLRTLPLHWSTVQRPPARTPLSGHPCRRRAGPTEGQVVHSQPSAWGRRRPTAPWCAEAVVEPDS